MDVLLSTAYLPPIDYIRAIKYAPTFKIERFESYQKQSYRNRCHILSANGSLPLYIPVEKGEGGVVDITGIKIDNTKKWQHQHWQSIVSAYKSSPFFDFYSDDFEPFYSTPFHYLMDFNTKLLELILELLEFDKKIDFTESYVKNPEIADFRSVIHPKKRDIEFSGMKKGQYHQVFAHKFGFISGLSVVDLLFNEGPMSPGLL